MANIKSAKKRILVAQARNERNKAIRSEVKTYIKRVYAAVESGDKAAAQDALKMAQKKICMAHSKGIYKANNASRKVAHISKAVASMNGLREAHRNHVQDFCFFKSFLKINICK